MLTEKINKFILLALQYSNIDKKILFSYRKKYICIILKNTSIIFYIEISEETLILREKIESEPDLVLEGSPIAFFNYFNNVKSEHSIKIFGNASLAESFSSLFLNKNINWEQIIAESTNDEIAFYSSKLFIFLKEQKNIMEGSLLRNLKEYFRDESDIIPKKEDINNFIEYVDNLRNKIDVIDVKLKKIIEK